VLELAQSNAAAGSCLAEPDALSGLAPPPNAYLCWIAPDEAMLLGPPESAEALLRAGLDAVSADDDAVVLDVSDGWSCWTLSGAGAPDLLSQLSELEIGGDGYLQGDVARVPVRLVAFAERVHLLVPAMWEEHLRSRLRGAGADLDLRLSPDAPWSLG